MAGVRNDDYTDRELLHVISRCSNGDWASSTEIGEALGFTANARKPGHKTPASKVASRLYWMRTYGFLESWDEASGTRPEAVDKTTLWRVTAKGRALMGGTLSKAVQNALERMEPGQQLLLMREITRTGYLEADQTVAVALRREYQHQTAQRKLSF